MKRPLIFFTNFIIVLDYKKTNLMLYDINKIPKYNEYTESFMKLLAQIFYH